MNGVFTMSAITGAGRHKILQGLRDFNVTPEFLKPSWMRYLPIFSGCSENRYGKQRRTDPGYWRNIERISGAPYCGGSGHGSHFRAAALLEPDAVKILKEKAASTGGSDRAQHPGDTDFVGTRDPLCRGRWNRRRRRSVRHMAAMFFVKRWT